MGIDSVSTGFNNMAFPGDSIGSAIKSARDTLAERREAALSENRQHRSNMERDAQAQQYNVHNMVLGSAIQHFLDTERHGLAKELETHKSEAAKAFETHKTNEAGRSLTKMGNYAKKTGAQMTDFRHENTSARFTYPAAGPAPSMPDTPAQTNKPKPPPVGNALSAQFSHQNSAPQPQGQQPLRPQP